MSAADAGVDAVDAARQLAAAFDKQGREYALGGALALGYWATPRGTLDVDLTLFLDPEPPDECIRALQDAGCDLDAAGCGGRSVSTVSAAQVLGRFVLMCFFQSYRFTTWLGSDGAASIWKVSR